VSPHYSNSRRRPAASLSFGLPDAQAVKKLGRRLANPSASRKDSLMWTCHNCGERCEDSFEACWNCEAERDDSSPLSERASNTSKRAARDFGTRRELMRRNRTTHARQSATSPTSARLTVDPNMPPEEFARQFVKSSRGNLPGDNKRALGGCLIVLALVALFALICSLTGQNRVNTNAVKNENDVKEKQNEYDREMRKDNPNYERKR
jgi:hypothetical protein